MKFKKILGLALSAAMAVSAVVPWTGVTALAADYPETDKELNVYMNPNNYGKGGYFVHEVDQVGDPCTGSEGYFYEDEMYTEPEHHYVVTEYTSNPGELVYVRCDKYQEWGGPEEPEQTQCNGHNYKYIVCDDDNQGHEEISNPQGKIYCDGECNKTTSFKDAEGNTFTPLETVTGKKGGTYTFGCEKHSDTNSVTWQGNTVYFHYVADEGGSTETPPKEDEIKNLLRGKLKLAVTCENNHDSAIYGAVINDISVGDITFVEENHYTAIVTYTDKWSNLIGNYKEEHGLEAPDFVLGEQTGPETVTIHVNKVDGEWVLKEESVTFHVNFECTKNGSTEPETYTIKYEVVGDIRPDVTIPADVEGVAGTEIHLQYPNYVPGYTFQGWYTDEACTVTAKDPYTIIGDATLYCKWTKNDDSGEGGEGEADSYIMRFVDTEGNQLNVSDIRFDIPQGDELTDGALNFIRSQATIPAGYTFVEYDKKDLKDHNVVYAVYEKDVDAVIYQYSVSTYVDGKLISTTGMKKQTASTLDVSIPKGVNNAPFFRMNVNGKPNQDAVAGGSVTVVLDEAEPMMIGLYYETGEKPIYPDEWRYTVHYVDEATGTEIAASETGSGAELPNHQLTVSIKDISDYTFVRVMMNDQQILPDASNAYIATLTDADYMNDVYVFYNRNADSGDGGNTGGGDGGFHPVNPGRPSLPDPEPIVDPETPLAPGVDEGNPSNPGAEDAIPGGPSVEEDMPEEETPLSDGSNAVKAPPETGRKLAGSLALLAGAAVVAAVTLKKRED